ncbi:hypothetical protein Psp6_00002 [Pseudomonas phage Psp6]|nr:hypothetical protein Psp6_00002 [Pseudomonas phage Psp6]
MLDRAGSFAMGIVYTILMYTHPWAAVGAGFGCVFFLTLPAASTGWKRFKLVVFSYGLGYAAGVFFYGGGPPYSEKAMFVSAGFSALGAVVFTAFYYVVDKNGPLPPWLESILDRIPMFKRGGNSDGA